MASNLTLIKKLQHAINEKGGKLLYQTKQWYSNDQERPVTTYSIRQAFYNEKTGKTESVELFSSTAQIQIVLFLRDYWYKLNGWEVPNDNEVWNDAKADYLKAKGGDTYEE